MNFLREYWAWITLPFVIVMGILVLFLWMSAGNDQPGGFVYHLF